MKQRPWWPVCLLILLVVAGCGRSAKPTSAPTPVQPPVPAARSRIFAGVPLADAQADGTRMTGFGEVQTYQGRLENGEKVAFALDSKTGDLRTFYRFEQQSALALIDLETAKKAAVEFASEHYPGFKVAAFEQVRAELVSPAASSPKVYSFHWVQIDPGSKAVLPNEVRVRVNAETGQVDSYSALRVDVTVPTRPKVNMARAKKLALKAVAEIADGQVIDSTLFVSTLPVYEPNGKQALLWAVIVQGQAVTEGYSPQAMIYLDALTGQVVHVERS